MRRRLFGLDWRVAVAYALILALAIGAVVHSRTVYGPASHAGEASQAEQDCETAKQANGGKETKECKDFATLTLEDPIALYTFVLTVATIFLGVATAGLWYMAARQGADFKNQLTLAYPPRIKVGPPQIWVPTSDDEWMPPADAREWVAGDKLRCRVSAVNYGREVAPVVQSVCVLHWNAIGRGLPMRRPTVDADKAANPLRRRDKATGVPSDVLTGDLAVGENCGWLLDTIVPPNVSELDLYVIGHIVFTDRLGTRRATIFTRKYNPSRGVFRVDPDYEAEE